MIHIQRSSTMRLERFQAGQVIFPEGETSQDAYRILRGKVEITIAGRMRPVILAQLGPGDIFGEMAMVDERPRSATARCLLETECEVMSPADFQSVLLHNPQRLLPYLATFFERLRTVNDRLQMEIRLRAGQRPSTAPPRIEAASHTMVSPPPLAGSELLPARPVSPPPAAFTPVTFRSVTLEPWDENCASRFSESFSQVEISKFPFRMGRGAVEEEGRSPLFSKNDLAISDHEPYQVSRSHCSIEREGDRLFVRDRGSRLGTIVNDTLIGVHHSGLTAELRQGENRLLLGSAKSPFQFRIHVA